MIVSSLGGGTVFTIDSAFRVVFLRTIRRVSFFVIAGNSIVGEKTVADDFFIRSKLYNGYQMMVLQYVYDTKLSYVYALPTKHQ